MSNTSWFEENANHKSFRFGPHKGAWTALCKIAHRNQWPNEGCYSPYDNIKRNWKDVTCKECLKMKPRSKHEQD